MPNAAAPLTALRSSVSAAVVDGASSLGASAVPVPGKDCTRTEGRPVRDHSAFNIVDGPVAR